ncbi:MAG: hypothetical protein K8T26_20205 [Lentisphaerae bacterium]|nr:hypothetical protein [Lentisphaerota bacterium]
MGKVLTLRIQGRRASRRMWRELRSLAGATAVEPDFTPVTYSYYLREAERLGITPTLLPNAVLRLEHHGRIRNLYHSYSDFDGDGSLRIAGDKVLCSTLLQRAGVPVPAFTVLAAGDWRGALAFQQRVGTEIVIKPAGNTGDSLGVCIKPPGRRAVRRAVFEAGALCPQVLVETFVEGTNYRLLFCNHRFLAAAARLPACVVGDGSHTVSDLIARANAGRLPTGEYHAFDAKARPLLYRIVVDRDVREALRAQGYTPQSIPPAGQRVRLQSICHWLRGGEYRDVTDDVHPALVEAGRQATLATGIKLAGVDLIARDIRDPSPGSFAINEVNTTPGVLVHYEVQNQDKLRPVCREILKEMFAIA